MQFFCHRCLCRNMCIFLNLFAENIFHHVHKTQLVAPNVFLFCTIFCFFIVNDCFWFYHKFSYKPTKNAPLSEYFLALKLSHIVAHSPTETIRNKKSILPEKCTKLLVSSQAEKKSEMKIQKLCRWFVSLLVEKFQISNWILIFTVYRMNKWIKTTYKLIVDN